MFYLVTTEFSYCLWQFHIFLLGILDMLGVLFTREFQRLFSVSLDGALVQLQWLISCRKEQDRKRQPALDPDVSRNKLSVTH